ncbi:hypothetical protein MBLNU459_g4134t1 [Dothideomycetes sp. NU459]
MPGILPMKVIKVGVNSQARIAQACDRCRSKKIRCDGIRPCCSQCSSVGFECKTSDKLSRRAFPRGYTESLEERVRALEGEVRDLKDLLDEKDEKIDLLSRLHSQSAQPAYLPSPRRSSLSPPSASQPPPAAKADGFKVQQSPYFGGEGLTSYFAGTSSGKTLIDAFKQQVQETGRSTHDIDCDSLLTDKAHVQPLDSLADPVIWKAPPRLESDKMIGVFFQEWAPLFPVLHRPTFLCLYQKYIEAPDTVVDNCSHAQLNLVFGIAALSQGSRDSQDLLSCEMQWQAALDTILTDHSMPTLQCLILAQLYCIQRGDHGRLLNYKALATSLSSRLGLHHSQKRFALGTSTCEIRKKVFWTLYVVDCFSSVILGLPKQLKDDDINCEYPVDADEEYIEESGFKAPCPGECTRLSSALALFRAARILSRVLEELYPSQTSYDVTFQKISELSDELDKWHTSLAPHLRMIFALDKPSTGTISNRAPLLSLVYHYIRTLIHRPAVCASLGARASSSRIAMADSCKKTIQIFELLEERNLSFAFSLNKDELLVLSGIGLLYQSLDLDVSSKMFKDIQIQVAAVDTFLAKANAPSSLEFSKIALSFLPNQPVPTEGRSPPISRHNSDGAMPAPDFHNLTVPEKNKIRAVARKLMTNTSLDHKDSHRRATVPNIAIHHHMLQTQSQPNLAMPFSSEQHHMPRSEPARSPEIYNSSLSSSRQSVAPPQTPARPIQPRKFNLDYLSFSNVPTRSHSPDQSDRANTSHQCKTEPSDWELLLGSIDNGQANIFDNIYGGPPVEFFKDTSRIAHNSTSAAPSTADSLSWNSPDMWNLAGSGIVNVCNSAPSAAQPESVFSLGTDDGTASGEEVFGNDWGSASSTNGSEAYAGIVMPDLGGSEDELLAMWTSTAV